MDPEEEINDPAQITILDVIEEVKNEK